MLLRDEKHGKTIRRSIALEESVSAELDLYAKALDSSANWVVNQALSFVFAKDKDFQAWKEAHPAEAKASDDTQRKPRMKKAPSSEEPSKK